MKSYILNFVPPQSEVGLRPLSRGRRLAYLLMVVTAFLEVLILSVMNFTAGDYFAQSSMIMVTTMVAGGAFAHAYGFVAVGRFLDALWLPSFLSALGGIAILIAAALSHGFVDAYLAAADATLGFDLPALIHWVDAHPAMRSASNLIYMSFTPQLLLLPIFLTAAGQHRRFHTFCVAWALQLMIGIPIFYLTPAASAFPYYGLPPQSVAGFDPLFPTRVPDTIHALQTGALRDISKAFGGLITIPSFHAANAILFIFASWRLLLLRWLFLVLNILMLGATLASGSHYLVDVIAGVAMALIAIWMSQRIIAFHGPD